MEEVRATCPPIAGIANGAMVLRDQLHSKMSTEEMKEVLGPKIDGTNNLDQLFRNENLDFFVLFSSASSVIGNSGQSNYAAANGYLMSIARQRRARGLAASTFDIGRVTGLGYVESVNESTLSRIVRNGLMGISEWEIRYMFAETILAGYPTAQKRTDLSQGVVTTGIREVYDDEEAHASWFVNPRFSHFVVEAKAENTDTNSKDYQAVLPMSEKLSNASNAQEALEILQGKIYNQSH